MTLFLKQSTASQSVLIGPFIDATDGVTAETGLTIANTDIRLSKNGGNMAAKNSGGGTHDEEGLYTITLDATDTNTVGVLQLSVQDAAHLPVYHEYHVLEEAVYDDLIAASAAGYAGIAELATVDANVDLVLEDTGTTIPALLPAALVGGRIDANVGAISADATAADNAEAFFDGTGYAGTNNVIPTVTTLTGHTAQTGDSFARIGANGASLTDLATAASIAALNDLSAAEVNAEVDTAFTTQMADSTVADGTIPTREQALLAITRFLFERSVTSTTVTVTKEDGSTAAMTFTLDDATNPTSITRAT